MKIVKFLILALCGLAIRLWLVPQCVDMTRVIDAAQYDQFAANILQHGVYSDDVNPAAAPKPNARRVPGYPLFLAMIYGVRGLNNWRAVQIMQALVDLLTCWVVYRTARELFRDRLVGFWSFGTALITPPMLIFTGYIMPETLATFWTTLAVFCTLKACRANHVRYFIGLGISCAAAALLRPMLIALPLFLLPAFWLTPEGRRFLTAKRAGLAVLCGLVMFLPWVTRNAVTLGQLRFLNTTRANPCEDRARGFDKWASTWSDSQAYNRALIFTVVYQGKFYKPDDLPSVDSFPAHAFDSKAEQEKVRDLLRQTYARMGLTKAIDDEFEKLADGKIRAHPVRYWLTLPLYRMVMLWAEPVSHWFTKKDAPVRVIRFAQLINIAIVAFGLAGMWVLRKNWRDTAPLWLAIHACTVTGMLVCFTVATVNPRYVAPAYPVMCIFAAACAFHLTRAKTPLKTSTEIYEMDSERW
ncbi:MAG: glycosyltransferase family 39 protein [Verrucomicrobia bacterium]|nr:glycosyltransferase family 39 protein [Verrucomicrobiota bacterium]